MRRRKKLSGGLKNQNKFIVIIFLLLLAFDTSAQVSIQEAFPNLEFTTPVDIQHPGDGTNRLFVVEQEGIIRVFENSSETSESKVFLDITDKVKMSGEMGMLGLAFHPDYEINGYFFVNYTTGEPEDRTIISRYQVSSNPDSADPESETRFLRQVQPDNNHNGGQLVFGPDGYLYVSLGDGGGAGDPQKNAQNLETILGTIIRINVDSTQGNYHFTVPPGNPFRGNPHGYREEIFAYGLRNPWRFSIDTLTGNIWCADVGQGGWEEINIIVPGGNYGWPYKEGSHCFDPAEGCDTISGIIDPVWEYPHTFQGGSITGGFVYRGSENPYLYGKYIYADFMQSKIWALKYDSIIGSENELLSDAPGPITSFGVDQNQELYFCAFTSSGNKLYKFTTTSALNDNNSGMIDGYKLYPAFPNPFNPTTVIQYNIPEESYLKMEVYSPTGELISKLKDEITIPGNYQIRWNADGLSSGMYLIKMETVSTVKSKHYTKLIKVMLLK